MHAYVQGTLTASNSKQHIAHQFSVPAGATELCVRFDYTPARVPSGRNALHLSLFDPDGFRGAGHRRGTVDGAAEHYTIILSDAQATPGYLPGPLPPGVWSIVIDSHLILPDESITYQLTIDTSNEPVDKTVPVHVAPEPPQRGPGWYRGDLHAHTVHSDAVWHSADIVAAARAHGLDFVTLSDHNTTSGLAEFDRLAQPDLLTMGGIELTTYAGHALALGVRHWIDWRVQPATRTMPQIAAEVQTAGGLFIIAHPMSVGDPICTGCDWRYADMMPGPARIVEVWNGGAWASESNNENALALWYVWLNQGHRMVATAGTDAHGAPPTGLHLGFNVVYADSLNEAAVLHAIAQGHLFLSDGPQLELNGRSAGGAQAMMGDSLPAKRVTLNMQWADCSVSDHLRLITDGKVVCEQATGERGVQQWELSAGTARWCVLEVRDAHGQLRAVTNPIFLDAAQE